MSRVKLVEHYYATVMLRGSNRLGEGRISMNGIHCYELLQDLAPRGSAEAVLLRFQDGRYVRTQNRITVFDFVDTHGDRGDRGYAFKSEESGKWEALSGLFQQTPSWSVL